MPLRNICCVAVAMMLLAGALTTANDQPPLPANAPSTSPTTQALRIRVAVPEGGKVLLDKAEHFSVVIENVSKEAVEIPDEWNSWGYFSLTFEYTTQDGSVVAIKKLPRGWRDNGLTATTIRAGEVLVRDVYCDSKIWEHLPTLPRDAGLGVTLKAIFAQEDYAHGKDKHCWTGRIESVPQKIIFLHSNR